MTALRSTAAAGSSIQRRLGDLSVGGALPRACASLCRPGPVVVGCAHVGGVRPRYRAKHRTPVNRLAL